MNPPTMLDLICEYVNERLPQYHIQEADTNIEPGHFLGVSIPFIFSAKDVWHVAIVTNTKFYIDLPNDKFVNIDLRCPGSLDVAYRLVRLDIAKRLKKHHQYIKRVGFPNRKTYMANR